MTIPRYYFVFILGRENIALDLPAVICLVPMVELTPLPGAPSMVSGIINVRGDIVPVIDVRKRFGFTERDPETEGQLVIARTSARTVALRIDSASGVIDASPYEAMSAQDIVPGLDYIKGVVKYPDGLILIANLDAFLSLEESIALERAMEGSVMRA
jgi:purine-binding chemotaxis protein CheW